MSFFKLLILLSLILVVPIFFVLKEKSKRAQSASVLRHRAYLQTANEKLVEAESPSAQASSLAVIEFSSKHPFIKLLYDERVPDQFQAIMDNIGQQYERIHHHQLTESQLFTLNKLVEVRIPDLITDYLSLDPDYAKTAIVDSDKSATSYDIVMSQLQSILDFTEKLKTQSQSGVVDKLLASRFYLDEVYQDSGMTEDNLTIK